jgi:hypothetical protein
MSGKYANLAAPFLRNKTEQKSGWYVYMLASMSSNGSLLCVHNEGAHLWERKRFLESPERFLESNGYEVTAASADQIVCPSWDLLLWVPSFLNIRTTFPIATKMKRIDSKSSDRHCCKYSRSSRPRFRFDRRIDGRFR